MHQRQCLCICHWSYCSERHLCISGCQALQDAVAKSGSYEPGSLQQLQFFAACVNGNAHATGHQAGTNSTTALGMYPVLSMFNHSCNPNLAQSSIGESATADRKLLAAVQEQLKWEVDCLCTDPSDLYSSSWKPVMV